MNLVEAFLAHAQNRPASPAIIEPSGRVVSYGELERLTAARARAFAKAGIGPGDVVLVARGVSVDLYAALIAVFRLGAVAMFPEPAAGLKGAELAVAAGRPKAMVAGLLGRALRLASPVLRALPLLSEPEADRQPGDGPLQSVGADAPALMTFTSGSTGRPKGIVRSAGFLQLQHQLLEALCHTRPEDVDLISLPIFILSNLVEGAASVIPAGNLRRPARLDGARLKRQMSEHKVNRIIAPPAVCAKLAEAGDLGVEAIFTGGGPVFPNLLQALRRAAPGAPLHAVYGSTEAEPIAHLDYDAIEEADWRAMSEGAGLLAGRPIDQIQLRIVEDEIRVSGPHVNRGYLDPADDASTKEWQGGVLWHRTGDAGRLDDQGRLWLLGRKEAALGGLYPFAIETAALSWPGVRQAALLADADGARLIIAGARLDQPDLERRARALGVEKLIELKAIPMDRRHNSKVDYARLRSLAKTP